MGAGQLSLISSARRLPGSQRLDTIPANLGTLHLHIVPGFTEFPYSLRGCPRGNLRTLQTWQGGQQTAGT